MCGIAGTLQLDGSPADSALVVRMCEAIRHRGPDDAGLLVEGIVGLGHRRLSIIDLSRAGHQPMTTGDERWWIVFNGEIYNYRELRRELEAFGAHFRTNTDTEVLIHAWDRWGRDALRRFRGMWAFAIWDRTTQSLTLVRDRYGIKPLYWGVHAGRLGFGSELKAVVPHVVPARPDEGALAQLALYQVRTDATATAFADVRQLAPGTLLHASAAGVRVETWFDHDSEPSPAETDPAMLRRLLEESVDLHLRSDVPVGACLSGGLDSSALVALAAPRLDYPLQTFSVVYPDTTADESEFATAVARHVGGVQHHVGTPDGRDAIDVLDRVVWHFEDPVWGEATYSWWHVMRLVHSHGIKVVVNGQGADELLGGYPYYYPSRLRELLVQGRWREFGRELQAEAAHQGLSSGSLARSLATPIWPGWLRRTAMTFGAARSWDPSALGERLAAAVTSVDDVEARRGFWSLEQHLRTDFSRTRLPMLLQAEDRFSMAFSIESRVPFLDAPLVAWARRLPPEAKLRCGTTKVVLREAVRPLLPAAVVDRPDKRGYPTPLRQWFTGAVAEQVGDRLNARSVASLGLLNPPRVRAEFDAFRRGAPMPHLWRYLSLQSWGEQFLQA